MQLIIFLFLNIFRPRVLRKLVIENSNEHDVPKTKKLVLGDLLSLLRKKFVKGTQQDFEDLIVELGNWTKDGSEKLFEKLRTDGIRGRVDEGGWWTWV